MTRHAHHVITSLEQNVFPDLRARPIADIDPPELLAVLRKIEARGTHEVTARVKQRCRAIFQYAVATGRARVDPTRDLGRDALTKRQQKNYAALKASELPEFLLQLATYDGHRQNYLREAVDRLADSVKNLPKVTRRTGGQVLNLLLKPAANDGMGINGGRSPEMLLFAARCRATSSEPPIGLFGGELSCVHFACCLHRR